MMGKGRCVLLMVPPWFRELGLLALLLPVLLASPRALAVCPASCSCSDSHREVDCSWRGLRSLPHGLQHNIHALNLSHNRLSDLDHALSPFTHLRSLDLSHNRLSRLPSELPRSLWELHAAGNRLRTLHKNDTAYHWNLRLLDLSGNKLERVVFINNTMPSLRTLDLSRNRFWTVPTNIPRNAEIVNLSHNTLVQVLPRSLDQLSRLSRLYLHSNRFTTLTHGALDRLATLRLITLGDNPWACDEPRNITYLLSWLRRTHASVLGCPCHTWHTCGETHLATTRGWHYASYTMPPQPPRRDDDDDDDHDDNDSDSEPDSDYELGPGRGPGHRHRHHNRPGVPPMRAVTGGYWPESVLLEMHRPDNSFDVSSTQDYESRWPPGGFYVTSAPETLSTPDETYTTQKYFTASSYHDEDTTEDTLTTTTRKSPTLRTRSVQKGGSQEKPRSYGNRPDRALWLLLSSSVLAAVFFFRLDL